MANEGLADYVDAFCEKGYFGLEETQSLLDAAASHGIKSKVHVNQFNAFGGVKLCVNSKAVSVDHLEELSAEDVEALKSAADSSKPTFATALPGCSYFLGIPYTPVHELMKADVPQRSPRFQSGFCALEQHESGRAVGHFENENASLEAIAAATINGAAAMECSERAGVIARGRAANVS